MFSSRQVNKKVAIIFSINNVSEDLAPVLKVFEVSLYYTLVRTTVTTTTTTTTISITTHKL